MANRAEGRRIFHWLVAFPSFLFFVLVLFSVCGLVELMKSFGDCPDFAAVLEGSVDDDLSPELWRACAGPLVDVPRDTERVFYFPQGHMEQVSHFFFLPHPPFGSRYFGDLPCMTTFIFDRISRFCHFCLV